MGHCWNHTLLLRQDVIYLNHKGVRIALVKVVAYIFLQDGRCKGAKGLTVFDARIEDIFHIAAPWISQNGAIAQRTWPPLHTALKPADHIAVGYQFGYSSNEVFS